jgi:hypothetical protein
MLAYLAEHLKKMMRRRQVRNRLEKDHQLKKSFIPSHLQLKTSSKSQSLFLELLRTNCSISADFVQSGLQIFRQIAISGFSLSTASSL